MNEEINRFASFDDRADPRVPSATLQIYEHIYKSNKRTDQTHVNRASAASMCYKRRWFQRKGTLGEPITPRKEVNFLMGAIAEKTLLSFIDDACVGNGKLYKEVDFGIIKDRMEIGNHTVLDYIQDDLLAVTTDGIEITAHADGWGKRNSDGLWELIECKSAANYGFKEFQDKGPGDYLKQAMTLLQTNKAKELGATEVRFFYLRKETGHIWDRLFPFDPFLWDEVQMDYKLAQSEVEPIKPYAAKEEIIRGRKTGRHLLPFPCNGYCPYTKHCFNYRLDFSKDQWGHTRPTYVAIN